MYSPGKMTDRISGFSQKIQKRYGLRQLKITKPGQMKPYARQVFQLVNEAYGHLYGFVELTDEQMQFYTDQYFRYVNPEFVSVILNKQDEVVAFGIAMPSLSKAVQRAKGRLFPLGFWHIFRALKKNDRADLYLIATRKEYLSKGVHVLIFEKILSAFLTFGIQTVETNPELETNLQVQAIWKDFDRRQHKRRRCYSKELV
jgi:hypothetical protein